jgi:hypothetical protein
MVGVKPELRHGRMAGLNALCDSPLRHRLTAIRETSRVSQFDSC